MAGIYLHIPFCKQKCTYCDFHFSTTYAGYRDKMITAMKQELIERKDYLSGETISTIYFGGGTPSLLTHEELKLLVDTIYANYPVASEIEFTLEANPDDVSIEQLEHWKEVGINRLSIGIQSFKQEDLDWMNRAHSVEEGKTALKLAREYGFFITADLIYGLPNHTLDDLKFNLEQLTAYSPEHVSAYCLSVEKGTILQHLVNTKQLPQVGEDEQADEFEYLVNFLKNKGYEQYEISSFARNEKYSVHNTNYWLGVKYLGIGPSAHSYDGKNRRWNIANNSLYIRKLTENETYYEDEVLSAKDRFNELLLTGLRTKWGVQFSQLFAEMDGNKEFFEQFEEFSANNLIESDEKRFFLTEKGKMQADHIAASLFMD